MTDHDEQNLITAYVDGRLSEGEAAIFEAHMHSCSSCHADVDAEQSLKLRLSHMPRRAAPAQLIRKLKEQHTRSPWWASMGAWFNTGQVWRPVGALTLAATLAALWFFNGPKPIVEPANIDLGPMLVAHARYQAESLAPSDMVASDFSAQLIAYHKSDYE